MAVLKIRDGFRRSRAKPARRRAFQPYAQRLEDRTLLSWSIPQTPEGATTDAYGDSFVSHFNLTDPLHSTNNIALISPLASSATISLSPVCPTVSTSS
jgi:hypothetical protein